MASGPGSATPGHLVLLGDSILDNLAYTDGGPDVVTHARHLLPSRWRATLCAVDGATTARIRSQLDRVPRDATHLVMSVGGNDALQHTDLLDLSRVSPGRALEAWTERLEAFEVAYGNALDAVLALDRPTVVCTIYNGALPEPPARLARSALRLFNDTIVQAATRRGIDVLDLREVCREPGDYANPIEPSDTGGRKIAAAIVRAVAGQAGVRVSRIWT